VLCAAVERRRALRAQGDQGRLASLRPELLPPVPAGCAPERDGRHLDLPHRLSLRRPRGLVAPVDPSAWASPPPSGIRRFVPLLTWLPAYDRGDLRFDVIAGATIWGLLIPEMIAYAGLAGLPPQAGLYTLLVTLAAYAVFGTSRHVVAAGTSAAAVL